MRVEAFDKTNGAISREEDLKALEKLKTRKQAGLEGAATEFLRSSGSARKTTG